MSTLLRIRNTSGRVLWEDTAKLALLQRDESRQAIKDGWQTLGLYEMRVLQQKVWQAEEALKAAEVRGVKLEVVA